MPHAAVLSTGARGHVRKRHCQESRSWQGPVIGGETSSGDFEPFRYPLMNIGITIADPASLVRSFSLPTRNLLLLRHISPRLALYISASHADIHHGFLGLLPQALDQAGGLPSNRIHGSCPWCLRRRHAQQGP